MYISVIVTCYNLELYIAEALESVVSQGYDPSLYEIVVVDDCSTDRSSEIIQSFQSVKYIKTPKNSGVLLTTVLGMQHAEGDVFAFLDGDDIWRSDKLSLIASRFYEDRSLVFLTHNYGFIDQSGKSIAGQEYTQKVYDQFNDIDEISGLIIDGILHRKNYVWLGSAYSIRLRTQDLSDFINWIKTLPNSQLTYQDWPLAFWIAASCPGRFGYISEKLFYYRIHSANYSGDSKSLEKAIRNWSKAYFSSLGLLSISEKFACDESVISICRTAVKRDEFILQLFTKPSQFSVIDALLHYKCFGSFSQVIKEFIRIFIIKFFGMKFYFFLKKFD
jgi:glycosyltransferase involved in cell wall biosynthesis